MRNLLNPKWLILINSLPIFILFLLVYGQYSIIHTLLNEENIRLWKIFGITLSVLSVISLSYSILLILKKQVISYWYSIFSLIFYIAYIYMYGYFYEKIIPFSIPQWMISGNIFLYVGTFLMPTLFYSIIILIVHFTQDNKEHKAWVNFLIAISIPIFGYIISQIILPLWHVFDSDFHTHILFIFLISATIIFLFFLIRGIIILINKKSNFWQENQLLWKIPITIILPIIGLQVNNGDFFNKYNSDSGIFGDFHNHWFYILAILNGIFICIPSIKDKTQRFLLFIARSITYIFTLYFFIVFLPFLPFSVVAIIAIGSGFLMLTPLIIFIIHTYELTKDFQFLITYFSKRKVFSAALISFLVIPIAISIFFAKDKMVLNQTLDYVYLPNYHKIYNINQKSLQKTLDVVKSNKNYGNRDIIDREQTPYISSFFNWFVLDNMTLSDSKINYIEQIFFNQTKFDNFNQEIDNKDIKITSIKKESIFDENQKVWKSWINIEITNKSNIGFAEFSTNFELPDGCYISDYYLYIGEKKEFGILAEKKSAMWVYSNIVNINRDPGILYYLTGNQVAFKVFPFLSNETRKTGIELIHKEPVKIWIDNNEIELGKNNDRLFQNKENEDIIYISANQKTNLKKVNRKPYFHFIVDVSSKKQGLKSEYKNRIDKFLSTQNLKNDNSKISFTNAFVQTTNYEKWENVFEQQKFNGGFFLDRAIKKTLANDYNQDSYPIIVVITDNIKDAIIQNDFSDLKFTFPESDLFYSVDSNGKITSHSFINNPKNSVSDSLNQISAGKNVLAFKTKQNSTIYVADDNNPNVIFSENKSQKLNIKMTEKNWLNAIELQAYWKYQMLHPETSEKHWLDLIKGSFQTKILTPLTSYISVENEAQKAILKKKQKEVLNGKSSYDIDDTQRMSEPDIWIMGVLVLILYYKKIKNSILLTIKS